eukprot:CAMPEP_0179012406 /NCGR_PEP_ID=MMETSP0796-20121207/1183_1 /TAXON_ID=73915 /ORGANISM="Pyrodinium bahamense, Strain pbaha01" /LENGTH=58 /DNA_ID=CAMNT_0020707855 /DNA_START=1 /DNA_END=177 /DNA_ORIENTATION=+
MPLNGKVARTPGRRPYTGTVTLLCTARRESALHAAGEEGSTSERVQGHPSAEHPANQR